MDQAQLAAIVVGIVEAIKQLGLVDSRWLPLVSGIAGMLVMCLAAGFSAPSILAGLAIGLGATGIYAAAKALASKRA